MGSESEPAKLLLPYLQRADELQKHEPLVAYYCRLYAMERGLKIPPAERTNTTKALLVSLMKQLEKDKKSVTLGPDDSLYLEGFASNVFAKADKQDRAGRADLNTAKTFYAASIFFEILNQFGELPPDLEQKQKYAAWKAVDIRKALKEGRKPEPGTPADDKDLSLPSQPSTDAHDFTASSTAPVTRPPHEPDRSKLPSRSHDNINNQQSSYIPPPQMHDDNKGHQSAYVQPPSSYPTNSYPAPDPHSPPHTNISENPTYSQAYHQPHAQEPQAHFPQYPSHETPSAYNYPSFQTYPSFSESSFPEAPSHYPTYHRNNDGSYSPHMPPGNFQASTPQFNSSSRNSSISEPVLPPAEAYQYDCNYQPPPEKIAEAHKAARFAVGALAFDDVTVAVDFLRKSLELLTNPSAGN
uniref:Uncharacterized protein n=1 Tax=Kalanchoe fedtschenkoi TaxID=63787 RepID=A0A7N0VMZ1_KALFE